MKIQRNERPSIKFTVRDLTPGSLLFWSVFICLILYTLNKSYATLNRYMLLLFVLVTIVMIGYIIKCFIGKEVIRIDHEKLIQEKFPFLKGNTTEYQLNKIKHIKIEGFESDEYWRVLGPIGPKIFITKYQLAFTYLDTEVKVGVGMNYDSCNQLRKALLERGDT